MEGGGFQCNGCGSTNVSFDPKARLLTCNQCGREEYYTRATLNSSGKVSLSRQNAMNFFLDGKYEEAKHYAMDVLNILMDNVPALYIMAYYDEFVEKRYDSIRNFFYQVEEVAIEYNELQDMIQLIKATAYRLVGFEPRVIELLARNMQSEDDAKELGELIDTICPYNISKRNSINYLDAELIGMYKELIGHCGIPKTCFALLKSIETNPDSPYANNSFFLSSKSKYFYEKYVLPIGDIIKCMPDSEIKTKFVNAYNSKCEKYKKDSGI